MAKGPAKTADDADLQNMKKSDSFKMAAKKQKKDQDKKLERQGSKGRKES